MRLLLLILLLLTPRVALTEESHLCSNLKKHRSEVAQTLRELTTQASHLKLLANGQKLPASVNPDLLFSINLDDESAVRHKKHQIEKNTADDDWQLSLENKISEACFKNHSELKEEHRQVQTKIKEITSYKLAFLGLDKQHRQNLLAKPVTDTDSTDLKTQSRDLEKSLASSVSANKLIEKSQQQAQQSYDNATTSRDKEIAGALVTIENYRAALANYSLGWFTDLKTIVDKYELVEQKTDEVKLALSSKKALSDDEVLVLYAKAKQQWRTLIDDGSEVYKMFFDSSELNKINTGLNELNLQSLPARALEKVEKPLSLASLEKKRFNSEKKAKIKERFDDFYRLLASTSAVRSKILTMVTDSGLSFFKVNDDFLGDLVRELTAIPFRFLGTLFQKYLEVQENLSEGLPGIWNIAQNLFSLVLIFCVPFLASYTRKSVLSSVDGYRSNLLRRRDFRDKSALSKALWLQRLTPYLPWILYLVFLIVLDRVLKGTIFDEMRMIIPIFNYVIWYKIFRVILADALYVLRSIGNIKDQDTKKLMDSTAKVVGYFFLYSFIFMYLTKITVDEGIMYRIVEKVVFLLGIMITFASAVRWKDYIIPSAQSILPEPIGRFLAEKCQSSLSIFFALPTLLIVLGKELFDALSGWLAEFEFIKRLLAKVYRKKIESIVGEQKINAHQKPDASYTELFEADKFSHKFRVDANQKAYNTIKKEIDCWLEHEEEDQSVAIYGEKGIGKSLLMDRIFDEYKDLNVIKLSVPPKICQKDSLNDFFCESFGIEKSGSLMKCILDFNNKAEKKTLVLVDNAHNLFLGKYGGFEAFQNFVDLVNLKTDKLFWCSVFNEYSWAYIKGVLGSSNYLRTEIRVDEWSDSDIKDMILQRHQQSDYGLSYDQMILASRSGSRRAEAVVQAEEQFFRLLWEQSSGNPTVALHLWINCISQRGKTFRVTLPEQPKAEHLSLLDDNTWFVLASIAKHENLTRNEATGTTNLNWAQVAHSIKLGIERKLVYKDEGNRYRLHLTYQYDLVRQLKMKNFIYGIK